MSLHTRISDFITEVGTDYKTIRTWLSGSSVGDVSGLNTTATNVVAAINEVKVTADSAGGGGWAAVDSSETTKGIAELATLAEVATGTDTTRVVTPAGVRQERLALRDEILGAGVPEALNTLAEFADALGDDADFAATTTVALGARLRVDVDTQALTETQQINGQTNLNVYSKDEIGDPETDLVALYTAAKL